MTVDERSELLSFLKQNEDVFSTSLQDLGRTDLYHHRVETLPNAPPVHMPFYRQTAQNREITQNLVEDMLQQGIIEQSNSIWHSPVVLVKKKDGTHRFAVDYRKLNKITHSISHPLPRLECVFDTLGQAQAKIFSTLDLASGFWQIPMDPETKHKAAFITHDSIYEWTRMPFGLKNAPMSFQMIMGQVLRGLNWKHVLCYIDDILVFSSNFHEHIQHLDLVFQKLREAKLTLKGEKCHFALDKVIYLGHVLSKDGIEVDSSKTEAVRSFPTPKTQRDVRRFLGLCNYYRRFVPNFSKMAAPMNHLLQKDCPFHWDEKCESSFQYLKDALTSAPMLVYPDMNAPFILSTDASGVAIGYILGQKGPHGKEMVVAYGGRSLRPEERNYSVSEIECLAVVEGIKAYREYLAHHRFTVYTDHKALTWLQSLKDPSNRLGRWAMHLQGYDYEVVHKEGRVHKNADALSRRPYDRPLPDKLPPNNTPTVSPIDQPKPSVSPVNQPQTQTMPDDTATVIPVDRKNSSLSPSNKTANSLVTKSKPVMSKVSRALRSFFLSLHLKLNIILSYLFSPIMSSANIPTIAHSNRAKPPHTYVGNTTTMSQIDLRVPSPQPLRKDNLINQVDVSTPLVDTVIICKDSALKTSTISSTQHIQVTFEYSSTDVIASVDALDNPLLGEDTEDNTNSHAMGTLQRQCGDFKDIMHYLETRELPDDKKRAQVVCIESEQYAIVDGFTLSFLPTKI
ncbi:MAG: reverse transcriptase family protein [Sedimenticola sp.]